MSILSVLLRTTYPVIKSATNLSQSGNAQRVSFAVFIRPAGGHIQTISAIALKWSRQPKKKGKTDVINTMIPDARNICWIKRWVSINDHHHRIFYMSNLRHTQKHRHQQGRFQQSPCLHRLRLSVLSEYPPGKRVRG